eukprot:2445774-Ditylum_brightwellii.AAC.1
METTLIDTAAARQPTQFPSQEEKKDELKINIDQPQPKRLPSSSLQGPPNARSPSFGRLRSLMDDDRDGNEDHDDNDVSIGTEYIVWSNKNGMVAAFNPIPSIQGTEEETKNTMLEEQYLHITKSLDSSEADVSRGDKQGGFTLRENVQSAKSCDVENEKGDEEGIIDCRNKSKNVALMPIYDIEVVYIEEQEEKENNSHNATTTTITNDDVVIESDSMMESFLTINPSPSLPIQPMPLSMFSSQPRSARKKKTSMRSFHKKSIHLIRLSKPSLAKKLRKKTSHLNAVADEVTTLH